MIDDIYDAHYRKIIQKFRTAVERDGEDVLTALRRAVISGIGLAQVDDLITRAKMKYNQPWETSDPWRKVRPEIATDAVADSANGDAK